MTIRIQPFPAARTERFSLIAEGKFTFGQWLEACDWDVSLAVEKLGDNFYDTYARATPHLTQSEFDSTDGTDDWADGVWDGGFLFEDGIVWYVGATGPSGPGDGIEVRRRVRACDVIEVI